MGVGLQKAKAFDHLEVVLRDEPTDGSSKPAARRRSNSLGVEVIQPMPAALVPIPLNS